MATVTAEAGDLYAKEAIRSKVHEIWARVFKASNRVIHDAMNYGFLGMDVIPDPNIHDMLVSIRMFAGVMKTLVTEAELRDDTDSVRLLLNATRQLTSLEELAIALKDNDEERFNKVLAALNSQAAF